jgi:hypothetical protein
MSSKRPYKVGTQRAPQRYIEPDVIYDDMRRNERVTMAPQFPNTWTPVNGLDGTSGFVDDLFNAVTNVGREVVQDTKNSVTDRASSAIPDLLKSTQGKQLLQAVEAAAQDGVVKEVKKNAPNLMLLAVAGGAVGGALSAKLGKTGTVLALVAAGWASWQLMNPAPPTRTK